MLKNMSFLQRNKVKTRTNYSSQQKPELLDYVLKLLKVQKPKKLDLISNNYSIL